LKGNVGLSDKQTPKNKRHIRRGEANPSRGLFVEENDAKETNKLKSLKGLINRLLKKEDIDPKTQDRRREHKRVGNTSREELSRSDFKPIHKFTNDKKHESEKNRRRLIRNIKTVLLLGSGVALVVAIVFGSISLFSKDKNDTVAVPIVETAENSKRVIIYIDGEAIEIVTELDTVGEVLAENEIEITGNQNSTHESEEKTVDGMEIFINNPMTVSVIHNEIVNSVTVYGGRVSDVFVAMEIGLDNYDIVSPHVDSLVTDGMKISFTDIEIKEIQVVEDLPYETEEGETSTVESGYYHVEEEGSNGAVQITYEVKLIDGVEDTRVEIKREVVQEPTNRVILWGTATPSSSSSSDSGNSSGGDSGSYDDIVVTNPGDQVTNPSIPSAPSEYIEIMSGHVTAYTHTGSTTATGTWPRSTRTLDNPGSCAVVPGTIPYGSLLYVTGYGYCIAEDTGGFRHDPDRWNQIDLFMNTYDECIIWGRRYDVKVYILRTGY